MRKIDLKLILLEKGTTVLFIILLFLLRPTYWLDYFFGSHVETLRIKYSGYTRLVNPKVGDFSVQL